MKILKPFFLFACLSSFFYAQADPNYDFSASINGKTLYFKYSGGGVRVTYPKKDLGYAEYYDRWDGYTKPTGNVTIPNTVTKNGVIWNVIAVDHDAFRGCSGITSIIVGDSVSKIWPKAFYECSGITTVVLGKKVDTISSNAFYGCYSITAITCKNKIPAVLYSNFSASSNILISVPCGTSTLYQNTTGFGGLLGWSQFSNYNEMPPEYTTMVYSQNDTMGSVSVNTCFDTIIAYANYGYHFTQWNDGIVFNPRYIELTNDTSFTAFFAANQYNIFGSADYSWKGSVQGGGEYPYLSNIALTAIPTTGYQFSHWTSSESQYNMSTDNPISITVTTNISLTAVFETSQHTLSVYSTDSTLGTTLGSGTYYYNSNATISAVPNIGCHFVQWNDGITTNPRQVHISSDTSFSAEFSVSKYIIKAQSDNTSMGTVVGTDTVYYGDVVVLRAIPNEHYEFSYWRDNHWNTYYENPLNITATEDAIYTAFFATEQFMVITTTDGGGTTHINELYGPSSGNYDYLQQLTLYAVPFEGVYFSHWEDGVTYNPRSVTITSDTTFMALFTTDPNVSINTTNTSQIKINTLGKTIIVFCNTTKGEIVLYDIMGRTLSIKDNKDGEVAFSVEKAGVYFVQVGNYPAKKVVVVK